ncbi:hypothetical protein AHAS_Ahas05G0065900 [Arachis hypogaea]
MNSLPKNSKQQQVMRNLPFLTRAVLNLDYLVLWFLQKLGLANPRRSMRWMN